MKLGATGIDRLQNDCSWMVIIEPSLNFNTVLQMIARLYRTGQQHVVRVFLLFLKDSIESYLWGKFQEKMSAEIVEWTTGEEAERDLRELLLAAGWEAGEELSSEDLQKGSALVVHRMFGADEDLARMDPHGRYYNLSQAIPRLQLNSR